MYDIWFLGERFLSEVKDMLLDMVEDAEKNKKITLLFIQEFFNIKTITNPHGIEEFATGRTINALIDKINDAKYKLPKYLVVMMDKDIIEDIDQSVTYDQAQSICGEMTRWLLRQINTAIRRKRLDLLQKRPGALSGYATKVVHVRMLCRVGMFHEQSRIHNILQLRPKYNDQLNDEAAKLDHYMLTIKSCHTYEDFDKSGKLSQKGKKALWYEIDDLLQRFDMDKVKLLPNPKNPPKQAQNQSPRGATSSFFQENRQHRRLTVRSTWIPMHKCMGKHNDRY